MRGINAELAKHVRPLAVVLQVLVDFEDGGIEDARVQRPEVQLDGWPDEDGEAVF